MFSESSEIKLGGLKKVDKIYIFKKNAPPVDLGSFQCFGRARKINLVDLKKNSTKFRKFFENPVTAQNCFSGHFVSETAILRMEFFFVRRVICPFPYKPCKDVYGSALVSMMANTGTPKTALYIKRSARVK